jgi:nickel/cobalt transporter (NicO) family protein
VRRSLHLAVATGIAVAAALAVASPVSAHPLGNFTINHFSDIEVSGPHLRIRYVLDYAEIPAFQEKQKISADPLYLEGRVAELGRGLALSMDGAPVPLRVSGHSERFLPGQGGLETLRIELVAEAADPSPAVHDLQYRDRNHPDHLGWKEVVARATGGARIYSATVPSRSASQGLTSYPQDLLQKPLQVASAELRFAPGAGAGDSTPVVGGATHGLRAAQDRFSELVSVRELTGPFLLVALLAAIVLGALHALEPGHGKALLAGYLVGTRGTPRHAVALGTVITATHTAGVFALGLVTLLAESLVSPERLYPWLTLASGLVIVAIGGWLLWKRLRVAAGGGRSRERHGAEGHEHGHPHHHDHPHPELSGGLRAGSLVALGVSAGLVPCPSALVVLLAAISLHRVLFGVALIVAFSLGLALALTGLGIAFAVGGRRLARFPRLAHLVTAPRLSAALPAMSALIVTFVGVALTLQAIPGLRPG